MALQLVLRVCYVYQVLVHLVAMVIATTKQIPKPDRIKFSSKVKPCSELWLILV